MHAGTPAAPADGWLEIVRTLLPLLTAFLGFYGGLVTSRRGERAAAAKDRRARLRDATLTLMKTLAPAVTMHGHVTVESYRVFLADVEVAATAYCLEFPPDDAKVVGAWLDGRSSAIYTALNEETDEGLERLGWLIDDTLEQLRDVYTGSKAVSKLDHPQMPAD